MATNIGPLNTETDKKGDWNLPITAHKRDLLTILHKMLFSEMSAVIFAVVKNEIVGWVLNFRAPVLLKSTVIHIKITYELKSWFISNTVAIGLSGIQLGSYWVSNFKSA